MNDIYHSPEKAKKLVLFFDGTGNDLQSDTNIHRLYMMLSCRADDGMEQRIYYCPGVGVKPFEKLRGGAFGRYLSRNIRAGYQWLRRHYNEGDEIYIFGFSRGAFTAVALLGFLAWCGMLRREAPIQTQELFRRYLNGAQRTRELKGKEAQKALSREELEALDGKAIMPEFQRVVDNTFPIRVKFLGVFDTVRCAGLEVFLRRSKRNQREEIYKDPGTLTCRYTRHVHNTVEQAYQALAIDEHRAAFCERVWITPKKVEKSEYLKYAEQRWFVGAHANVGGGYPNDELAIIPLAWMQQKAKRAGLNFKELAIPPENSYKGQIYDSYKEFGLSLFSLPLLRYCWASRRRYFRKIQATRVGTYDTSPVNDQIPERDDQHVRNPLNVTLDESVLLRICDSFLEYNPCTVKNCLHAIDGQGYGKIVNDAKNKLDKYCHTAPTIIDRLKYFKDWLLPGRSQQWPMLDVSTVTKESPLKK